MASKAEDEIQLNKKHEEILGKRSALLQQMEVCYEQQKIAKKQQAGMSQAARERNAKILEDLQSVEHRLQTRTLLHPDVLNLQTCYWASVERSLPAWEHYLLGKGKPPAYDASRSRVLQRDKAARLDTSPARSRGKPPRPTP